MNIHFKSALNRIKAGDALIDRTELYLREKLTQNKIKRNVNTLERSLFYMKKYVVATCLAILLIGGSVGAYAYSKAPVSYLSVDINPSVEFGINIFGIVVTVQGYNDDGKLIIKGLDLKGSGLKLAVNNLIRSAIDKGFIAADGSTVVSVTSETNNSNEAAKLENEAEAGVNAAIKSNDKNAAVYKTNVSLLLREEAIKLGITPGKLNLIKRLQSLDASITVDDYKNAKVRDIVKAIDLLEEALNIQDEDNDSDDDDKVKDDDDDRQDESEINDDDEDRQDKSEINDDDEDRQDKSEINDDDDEDKQDKSEINDDDEDRQDKSEINDDDEDSSKNITDSSDESDNETPDTEADD